MKLLYPVKLNKSCDLMESKCQASHRHTIRFCESQDLMESKCQASNRHTIRFCESQELMESKPLKAPKHAPNLHFSISAIYKSIPHFETAML